jgi:putative transposase
LIDNLVERGLDPTVRRLFIIDGSKALSKAIRRDVWARHGRSSVVRFTRRATFMESLAKIDARARCGASCGKPGNWMTPRRPKSCFAISRAVSNADWEGVAGSILEGIDEMLTVTRLGLPRELRRSLACTNIIENVMGTVRRVCRNVKHWRSPSMAICAGPPPP